MWTIRQNGESWELLDASGAVLSQHGHYNEALGALGQLVAGQQLAVEGGDGLLAEEWVSPIAFLSEQIAERDFSETSWIWRDPTESLLPLMLHTETDVGHFGAELAGFVTSISEANGTGSMRGRFYDSELGRAARDLLLGGRRFGVSVDPGERTEVEFRCTEMDDDGFCTSEEMAFLVYDVIGLTMTPFPGFARAHLMLSDSAPATEEAPAEEPTEDEEEDAPEAEAAAVHAAGGACCDSCATATRPQILRAPAAALAQIRAVHPERWNPRRQLSAASSIPLAPPAEWFADPQFSRLTAIRAEADGRVSGHLAPWGQCHTGYQGECVTTPRSLTNYASFRTGYVECADGSEVAVGQLTVGGGHADRSLSYRAAIEHYDRVGSAVADIACGEDAYGIWVAGALCPGVSPEQLRVLRACPPSGDWRPIGAGLELVAAAAVISQGFPVARVASSGRVLALVAAGHGVMAALAADPDEERLARMERQLAEMRQLAAAPARSRLRQIAADRLRARASA